MDAPGRADENMTPVGTQNAQKPGKVRPFREPLARSKVPHANLTCPLGRKKPPVLAERSSPHTVLEISERLAIDERLASLEFHEPDRAWVGRHGHHGAIRSREHTSDLFNIQSACELEKPTSLGNVADSILTFIRPDGNGKFAVAGYPVITLIRPTAQLRAWLQSKHLIVRTVSLQADPAQFRMRPETVQRESVPRDALAVATQCP